MKFWGNQKLFSLGVSEAWKQSYRLLAMFSTKCPFRGMLDALVYSVHMKWSEQHELNMVAILFYQKTTPNNFFHRVMEDGCGGTSIPDGIAD